MSGSAEAASTRVLAVDTGGTFTDLLLLEEGRLRILKVPSTPSDPAAAVLAGTDEIAGERPLRLLLHGSTVGTNALLEGEGARVLLVTNRGFEDVIEIGRQNRPQLYALVGHRRPPLVDRDDRIGIAGRMGPDGREIVPLDETELERLPDRIRDAESVAVVLLHSYANPEHERRVAERLESDERRFVSVSSRILPEYREYERASTTVVNARIAPVMARYLQRLDRETGGTPVRVMGSDGGALPVKRAARQAVRTVLSGPAGGVVGARDWARRAGCSRILTFDMGGTSTDVSVCPDGLLHTRELEIAGSPIAVPVIDIHTVGAGGGSLARVDPGGALRVGPESAGAEPGPISYGRGGEGMTVTDAHVWLRRLPEHAFLGGEGSLERAAVEPHLSELADRLGEGLERTAAGVLAVAESAMERALRVISVERGYDPADFTLVSFGGAGGLHAAELAGRLGTAGALVPPAPGLLSAYGMLAAPVTRDLSRSVLVATDELDHRTRIEEVFEALEREGVNAMVSEGRDPEDLSIERSIDARYRGQSFEMRVAGDEWEAVFHRTHRERYGYARPDAVVEAVTLRLTVTAPGPPLDPDPLDPAEGPPPMEVATAWVNDRWTDIRTVWRRDLRAGHRIVGPAAVLEYSATTWVPPTWRLEVDAWGCLHLRPPS